MAFNLQDYETVETRLEKFWEKYPEGRVFTSVIDKQETSILIHAQIFATRADQFPIATGIAEEIRTQSGVNKDAWVENCETSAIGRALANGGFGAKGKRPSREEMEKVARRTVTQDQIDSARIALEQLPDIKTVAELKLLFDGAMEANLLTVTLDGKSLNQHIQSRKAELEKK